MDQPSPIIPLSAISSVVSSSEAFENGKDFRALKIEESWSTNSTVLLLEYYDSKGCKSKIRVFLRVKIDKDKRDTALQYHTRCCSHLVFLFLFWFPNFYYSKMKKKI